MKILATTLAILCMQFGFSQKSDNAMNEKLLKELGDKACNCVDSVHTFGRKSTEIDAEKIINSNYTEMKKARPV